MDPLGALGNVNLYFKSSRIRAAHQSLQLITFLFKAKGNGTVKYTDSSSNTANTANSGIVQTTIPSATLQTSTNNIDTPTARALSQEDAQNQAPELKAFFPPLLDAPKLDLKRHLYSNHREESIEPTVTDEPSTPELSRSDAEASPTEEKNTSTNDEMTPAHELIATLSAQEAQLYSAMAASTPEERRRTPETTSTGNHDATPHDDLQSLDKHQLIATIRALQGNLLIS